MQLHQLKKKLVLVIDHYSHQHCVVAYWVANDPENTPNYFYHTRNVKVTGIKKFGKQNSQSKQFLVQQS